MKKFHKLFKQYTDCRTLGDRVGWWREERALDRREFAKKIHIPYSSLADIENNRQQGTAKVTVLAAGLQINAHYLASGKGDPLDLKAVPTSLDIVGELARMVSPDDLALLTPNEFELAQFRVRDVVDKILSTRNTGRGKKVS